MDMLRPCDPLVQRLFFPTCCLAMSCICIWKSMLRRPLRRKAGTWRRGPANHAN